MIFVIFTLILSVSVKLDAMNASEPQVIDGLRDAWFNAPTLKWETAANWETVAQLDKARKQGQINNTHAYIKSLYPLSASAVYHLHKYLQEIINEGNLSLAKVMIAYAEDIIASDIGKLVQSFSQKNLVKLKSLIKAGVNIDQEDEYQHTALWYTLFLSNLQVIALLIENGANINKAIPDFNEFIKKRASTSKKIQKIRELELFLKVCLEKEVQDYLRNKEAYCTNHIKLLIKDEKSCRFEFNQTLLMWSAIFNDIDTVKRLLKARPSRKYINALDIDKNSAFHYAIRFDNEAIVKELLEHIGNGFILKNRFGRTGLEIAAANNNALLFKRLLDEENRNMPALRRSLFIALKKNYHEIINCIILKLIKKGSILEQGKIVFPQPKTSPIQVISQKNVISLKNEDIIAILQRSGLPSNEIENILHNQDSKLQSENHGELKSLAEQQKEIVTAIQALIKSKANLKNLKNELVFALTRDLGDFDLNRLRRRLEEVNLNLKYIKSALAECEMQNLLYQLYEPTEKELELKIINIFYQFIKSNPSFIFKRYIQRLIMPIKAKIIDDFNE